MDTVWWLNFRLPKGSHIPRSPWNMTQGGGFNLKSPWKLIKTVFVALVTDGRFPWRHAYCTPLFYVPSWFLPQQWSVWPKLKADQGGLRVVSDLNFQIESRAQWVKMRFVGADGIAIHDPVPNSTHLSRHKFRWGRLDWLHQERCVQFWTNADGAQTCYPWPQADTFKNELSSMFYKNNNFWPKVVKWNCSPHNFGEPHNRAANPPGYLLSDIKRGFLSSLSDWILYKIEGALLLVLSGRALLLL